jgi:hypothetical protein
MPTGQRREVDRRSQPWSRGLATLTTLVLAVAALSLARGPVAHAASSTGGDYVPLAPTVHLLDTRNGTGGVTGLRGPGSTTVFPVLGVGGIPASGVSAVLVDVSPVKPTGGTYLMLWADGTPRPAGSMVNGVTGKIISNSAVVPVGANGKVAVFNSSNSTHISVDAQGYFPAVSSGGSGQGRFVPVKHTRLVDTRTGKGAPQAKIADGGSLTFTITAPPIPADAIAVYANFAIPSATADGWIAAYPAGGTAATSTLDYVTGTTSSGAAVKVGTGGKVTVTNHGSAAHLVVDVEGYFSSTTASGGRLQTVNNRVFDTRTSGTPLAAQATVDVAVGGTNGLPLRDIAGVAVNLTAIGPTTAGVLRAWPTGSTEPTTALNNFPSGGIRADLAVVQPGRDGKITIRNVSSGTVHVAVDLQGWYAPPVQPLPVEPFSRTSVIQAPTGALEYAYADNLGQLFEGRQADPSVFSAQWTQLSGNEAFTGQPALGLHQDGRVQVAAHNTDRDVWTRSRTSATGPDWDPWTDQGGSMSSSVTAGRLPTTATLVVFGVDVDGQLWHLPQNGANGPYTSWRNLGDADLAGPPTLATLSDGLQLVALDTSGAVKTATYRAGALSAWTGLGGSGFTGTPAVVALPGGRLRVVVRGGDGTIVTKQQDATGAWPSTWDPVAGLVAAGSPTAVLSPSSGRIELVARAGDGHLFSTGETQQASGVWRAWVQITDQFGTPAVAATDPSALTYSDDQGPTWGFAARDSDQVTSFYPTRTFTGPTGLTGLSAESGDQPPTFTRQALPQPKPSS